VAKATRRGRGRGRGEGEERITCAVQVCPLTGRRCTTLLVDAQDRAPSPSQPTLEQQATPRFLCHMGPDEWPDCATTGVLRWQSTTLTSQPAAAVQPPPPAQRRCHRAKSCRTPACSPASWSRQSCGPPA